MKRVTAAWFYRILRRIAHIEIPLDAGDFRLVDRRAVDAFRAMRERTRYVRGMFSWVGFRQIGVPYTRSERFAGEPKYSYSKSLKLAIDGIVSFSERAAPSSRSSPASRSRRSRSWSGSSRWSRSSPGAFVVPGWASILVVVSFLGGIQLTLMGMLGLYVGRIYEEVKARPIYIVRETIGFRDAPAPETASVELQR